MNGTKHGTEAAGSAMSGRRASRVRAKVDGQRPLDEARVIMPERVTIKRVRIPFAESLRFPGEGKSAQGQSDPKSRPKGVDDGRQVNIPAPPARLMASGRWPGGDRPASRGRGASPRTFTIPKSSDGQPRKADAGRSRRPY